MEVRVWFRRAARNPGLARLIAHAIRYIFFNKFPAHVSILIYISSKIECKSIDPFLCFDAFVMFANIIRFLMANPWMTTAPAPPRLVLVLSRAIRCTLVQFNSKKQIWNVTLAICILTNCVFFVFHFVFVELLLDFWWQYDCRHQQKWP